MRSLRTLALGALALALVACGESTTDPVEEDNREILADPSFAVNINEIIQRRGCASSGCHGNAAGGMTLTASAAANYAAWVDVPAAAESFLRVEPGNADDSYVVIKVEGRQAVGERMPLGGTALDNIDLTNLRNWINNGAPNN
ncbi:MAG: hypothetical protein AAF389_19295 [Gemmatimonadota bacterium]